MTKDLVEVHFPEAETMTVVFGNFNTYRRVSLDETLPAPEAHRIARQLDLQYTPQHGIWLNLAEMEFRAPSRQCSSGGLPTEPPYNAKLRLGQLNSMRTG